MKRIILFMAAYFGAASAAMANGFHIPVQSAEATARGNAFIATADTSSAVYYNPAGLTQLETAEVQLGTYSVYIDASAEVLLGNAEIDKDWQTVPQVYAAMPLSEKWTIGLGLNSPFGLSTDWGAGNPFAQVATFSEVKYVTGWITAAYEVNKNLSLGVGAGLSKADANLNREIGIVPGDLFSFEGDDTGSNFTLSALWKINNQHSFGAVYRSKTTFDLSGTAEQFPFTPEEPAGMDFLTPSSIGVGWAYSPGPSWTFEINLEQVKWSELQASTITKTTGDVDIPFYWEDAEILSLGMEHDLGSLSLRAGYNYITDSQPDSTYNPAIATGDRHWISFGVGEEKGRWDWNLAYQYAFSDRTVATSVVPLVQGEYETRIHSLSWSLAYKF